MPSGSSSASHAFAGGIERKNQEFSKQVGLGHFEGRGWRGFHHDASLCIVAFESDVLGESWSTFQAENI
jgi:SRSO17 transposase